MKRILATVTELPDILIWEPSFLALTPAQHSLCVALHRSSGPMQEGDLAAQMECTVAELRSTAVGIPGVLIDSATRQYWIK